jgi:hypothetical protein
MKLSYRISLEDYLEGQKLFWRMRPRWATFIWRLCVLALISSLAVLTYYSIEDPDGSASAYLVPLLIGLGVILLLRIVQYFRIRQAYRNDPTLRQEIFVDIDETHFEGTDRAGASGSSTWDYYDGFREGKRVFALRRRPNAVVTVPKSNLSPEELAYVRNTLATVLPRR